MSDDSYLGKGSRLDKRPASALAESAFAYELRATPYLHGELSFADMAHLRMLVACDIVPREQGAEVLRGLLELHARPLEELVFDPAVGDIYNNRDRFLQERIGTVSGVLHTGRARREATTVAWQLACRKRLVELGQELTGLVRVMLELVEEHRDTLMPDYTYLQHAHATTLGHYMMGFAYPLGRDLERMKRAFALVNKSPAGSGSVNGSSLPMDRDVLAGLLQFEGLIEHTRDAMWAPDMSTEIMLALVTTQTNLTRMAEELQIWATSEFGFVELDDAHCRTSVIMPQKKNPYGLAYIRGQARATLGRCVGVVSSFMAVTGQPDNRMIAYEEVPQALDWTIRSVRLLADTLAACEFDRDRMRAEAGSGYTVSTDICDFLVRETGTDNRSAHRIVGHSVRACIEDGERPVTSEDLRRSAAALDIDLPSFDESGLDALSDLDALVDSRRTRGGAGRDSMNEMIREMEAVAEEAGSYWNDHPLLQFERRFLTEVEREVADNAAKE